MLTCSGIIFSSKEFSRTSFCLKLPYFGMMFKNLQAHRISQFSITSDAQIDINVWCELLYYMFFSLYWPTKTSDFRVSKFSYRFNLYQTKFGIQKSKNCFLWNHINLIQRMHNWFLITFFYILMTGERWLAYAEHHSQMAWGVNACLTESPAAPYSDRETHKHTHSRVLRGTAESKEDQYVPVI